MLSHWERDQYEAGRRGGQDQVTVSCGARHCLIFNIKQDEEPSQVFISREMIWADGLLGVPFQHPPYGPWP